jgi:hypothetical protein
LVVVMVAGFVVGFLGSGQFAGFCLLVGASILLVIGAAGFTRGGGRAAYGRKLEAIGEQAEEARLRERDRDPGRAS